MPGSRVNPPLWITEHISPYDIYQHGVVEVLVTKRTAFQEMCIVETGTYGKALVLDGKWQSCTVDEFLYHEPLVHPACVNHGDPRTVLILGGGEGATVREVLKWNSVQKVVTVDIDGEVVEACKRHLPEMHQGAWDDPRTELIIGDALDYLDRTEPQWDVIISDLSDPIEEGPSFKLFTKEHFEKCRRALGPGGYVDEVVSPLAAGGTEAGEDLPGMPASLGLVAAGQLSGDHGGAQGAFRAIVGGLDAGVVQEREQPLFSLAETVGHPLFVGIGTRRRKESFGPIAQVPADPGVLGWRQIAPDTIEGHGRVEQVGQVVEEGPLILGFSIARLGNGFEVMGITLVHRIGEVLVAGEAIAARPRSARPGCRGPRPCRDSCPLGRWCGPGW